jgi:uncharacterized protein (TIGR02757 family)
VNVGAHLEEVYQSVELDERLAADPVAFPRRYFGRRDQEVAGLLAATLAYGRVELFGSVLDTLFARLDACGGPAHVVAHFDPEQMIRALGPLGYRFNTGIDWVLLLGGLQRVYAEVPSLEALLLPSGDTIEAGLIRLVARLRTEVVANAERCGVEAGRFEDLPRGLRYLLPSPSSGSACKRWNLYLRWMVRPATDGVDLGLWTGVEPRALVVPLDTHVLRISRFIGLTSRRDGSWRTALEVTDALRVFDPDDPVRFDFSLAHLGISGACRGGRHVEVCPTCPLDPLCGADPC